VLELTVSRLPFSRFAFFGFSLFFSFASTIASHGARVCIYAFPSLRPTKIERKKNMIRRNEIVERG